LSTDSQAETAQPEPLSLSYRFAWLLLDVIFKGYLSAEVSGRENLPPPGVATLLVPNHSSSIDVPACGHALRRQGRFLAKAEATRVPVVGRFLLNVGAIPARRDQQDTEALRQAMEVLRSGGLMGIAPEGTRSADGTLGEYDPGFVWLAMRTNALVVPLAIHGAYHLMPRNARLPRRGTVWVRVGEPISFADEGRRVSRERMQELADMVRDRTSAMLDDLAEESGVPRPETLLAETGDGDAARSESAVDGDSAS
jgi:1-acyl-sn-glycerol-3-phosphate acyltransferase